MAAGSLGSVGERIVRGAACPVAIGTAPPARAGAKRSSQVHE